MFSDQYPEEFSADANLDEELLPPAAVDTDGYDFCDFSINAGQCSQPFFGNTGLWADMPVTPELRAMAAPAAAIDDVSVGSMDGLTPAVSSKPLSSEAAPWYPPNGTGPTSPALGSTAEENTEHNKVQSPITRLLEALTLTPASWPKLGYRGPAPADDSSDAKEENVAESDEWSPLFRPRVAPASKLKAWSGLFPDETFVAESALDGQAVEKTSSSPTCTPTIAPTSKFSEWPGLSKKPSVTKSTLNGKNTEKDSSSPSCRPAVVPSPKLKAWPGSVPKEPTLTESVVDGKVAENDSSSPSCGQAVAMSPKLHASLGLVSKEHTFTESAPDGKIIE